MHNKFFDSRSGFARCATAIVILVMSGCYSLPPLDNPAFENGADGNDLPDLRCVDGAAESADSCGAPCPDGQRATPDGRCVPAEVGEGEGDLGEGEGEVDPGEGEGEGERICGDGAVSQGEACDDSDTISGDGCSATCTVEPGFICTGSPSTCRRSCGDGIVAQGEACDDGDNGPGDGCSATCTVEPGFACTGSPSTCRAGCGDGVVAQGEACDDADNASGDGCSAACSVEAGFVCTGSPSTCRRSCGDGVVAQGEACDDADALSGDGCSATCTVEAGFVCTGSPSTCRSRCGDGVVVQGEACDDADNTNGDGCSATCTVEPGFSCSGSPSTCASGPQLLFSVTTLQSESCGSLTLPASATVVVTTGSSSSPAQCPGDTVLTVAEAGSVFAQNDDYNSNDLCSQIGFEARAQTYQVCVRPYSSSLPNVGVWVQTTLSGAYPSHPSGGTGDLNQCFASADCQQGSYCVDNGGDGEYFCKPACVTDQDCADVTAIFPGVRCNESYFADGVLSSTQICNETFTNVLDYFSP